MPVTPFLRNQAFGPEQIETMAAAFEDACTALGLANRADAATEMVAGRIVELARCGVRERMALYEGAIEGLKPYAV